MHMNYIHTYTDTVQPDTTTQSKTAQKDTHTHNMYSMQTSHERAPN